MRQWIHTAKLAGMQYAILTVKHSSGFCLWNSKDYDYDVAASSNTTDVVAAFMKACSEEGIRPGFCYCILDASQGNAWEQKISDKYFQQVLKHLTELHTNYPGAIEQWIDIPDNCTQNQLDSIYTLVKKLNPACLVLLNQGLGISPKNKGEKIESGHWPTDIVNGEFYGPPLQGHDPHISFEGKEYYIPMEVCDNGGDNSNNPDNSSAGNWFYTNRYKLKPVKELYKLYKTYRKQNVNFLLNIPPTSDGLISEEIVLKLKELNTMICSNKGR